MARDANDEKHAIDVASVPLASRLAASVPKLCWRHEQHSGVAHDATQQREVGRGVLGGVANVARGVSRELRISNDFVGVSKWRIGAILVGEYVTSDE